MFREKVSMKPKFMKSLGIDVTSNLQTKVCKRNIKVEGWDDSKYKKQYENLNPTLQSSETSLFLALLPEQQKVKCYRQKTEESIPFTCCSLAKVMSNSW